MKTTHMTILAFVLLLVSVLMAGCATKPVKPPEPVIITQEVKVPVISKCKVTLPARPDQKLPTLSPDATVYDKGMALAEDYTALRKYSTKLQAALLQCVELPAAPTP